MTRWLYSVLMWLAQPLLRRKLQRRGRQEPGYLVAIEERFGCYTGKVPLGAGQTIWIHAVSLGETRAAAVLIAVLRAQLPRMRLLLTHGTATGREEGRKLLQPGDMQVWQPWDTPGAVARFLNHFQPTLGILMETEIWPNWVDACQRRRMPLVLANARLSDQSLRQALRLSWLARPAYAGLHAVWAQTQADAQRLRHLGASVPEVLGNLKFDATPDMAEVNLGRQWRTAQNGPVVLFASSRDGEELALLKVLQGFKENRPSAQVDVGVSAVVSVVNSIQWLIVPRHPQRFEAVATLVQAHGFAVSRRSQWPAQGPAVQASSSIWLGDSLGEMALYYGLADVALLGGSFEPLGGQNLIEAAACACPVVMGPHTFNFEQAAEQAQAAGAARRVSDLAQAVRLAAELVSHPADLAQAVQASEHFSQAHRGSAQRLVAALQPLLQRQM